MQTYVQRRRQMDVLRPRQPRNDVNAGALPMHDENLPDEMTQEERQDHYAKRCARRDLF